MSGLRWLCASNRVVCEVLIAVDYGSVFQGTWSRLTAFRTVRRMCTAHGCRSRPATAKAGRQGCRSSSLHTAPGQALEPAAPVEAWAAQAQVQPFAGRASGQGPPPARPATVWPRPCRSLARPGGGTDPGRTAVVGGRSCPAAGVRGCPGTPCDAGAASAAVPGRLGRGDRCRCTAKCRPRWRSGSAGVVHDERSSLVVSTGELSSSV